MATAGRFATGPFSVDYEARADLDELRRTRVTRARKLLDASELDALLVFKNENVRFLTGLRAQLIAGKSTQLNGCLLCPDREPILLISGGDLERAQSTMPWIEELHAIPILEAPGLIAGMIAGTLEPLLERLQLTRARVGIDECSYLLVDQLGRSLPQLRLAPGDPVMQQARLLKSPAEILVMEEAAAIAEAVTETALEAVAPGVRETEVAGEAMRTLYRLGGEMAHVTTPFVASGEHMSPPNRLCTDKLIREGDLVFIDIGAMWNGYFADMGRTTICGEPSRHQQEIYTAVHEGLAVGREQLRAGNTNDDVAHAVSSIAAEHGLAENFITLFMGHGVGMGANEPPYIGERLPGAETVTLEEGMTFALEPLIWVGGVPGGGGVRLEDTIVVERDGGRAITRTGFERRLLA